MSENNTPRWQEPRSNGAVLPNDEGGLRAPAHYGTLRKIWWWFDFLILVKVARLRFLAILGVISAAILYWDTLVAYYEKWTRPVFGEEHAASGEFEYFCPMHPQVVADNPKEKCPICAMNLSKRKKGEAGATAEALPAGVVTRLQLSPYKVVTANIRTWDVNYEPLTKKIETVGKVQFDERGLSRISARVKGRLDKLYANVTGQMVHVSDPLADIYSPDLVNTVQDLFNTREERDKELIRVRLRRWGVDDQQIKTMEKTGKPITYVTIPATAHGYVVKKYQVEGESVEEGAPLYDLADLATVWIEAQVYENDTAFLKKGLSVRATAESLPNREFAGKLAFVDPYLDPISRTLRVRFDVDNPDHMKRPEVSLRPNMWVRVLIDVPAGQLGQQYPSRDGRILAVPEGAVVFTGSQKIVYRQESPGVFDAVQVELGPLLTGADGNGYYPVTKGLGAGDRVVTTGSYLLDAETKVSGSAGSIYYGGTGGSSKGGQGDMAVRPTTPEDEQATVKGNLAKLSTPDRRLAEAQKFCPVRKSLLGSMGPPVKVLLKDQPVFLCCKGCEKQAKADPDRTLAEVEKRKAPAKPDTPKP
jgi:multidrug efflux pump subunit AcrA (membrane-fusion protein)